MSNKLPKSDPSSLPSILIVVNEQGEVGIQLNEIAPSAAVGMLEMAKLRIGLSMLTQEKPKEPSRILPVRM